MTSSDTPLQSDGPRAVPAPSRLLLVGVRDYLRMLTLLVEESPQATRRSALTPEAVAWCFTHMARDVDAVVASSGGASSGAASSGAASSGAASSEAADQTTPKA